MSSTCAYMRYNWLSGARCQQCHAVNSVGRSLEEVNRAPVGDSFGSVFSQWRLCSTRCNELFATRSVVRLCFRVISGRDSNNRDVNAEANRSTVTEV